MLSRRQLRVKVMQSLYSFWQSENLSLENSEKELLFSIQKIHELYHFLFLLSLEFVHIGREQSELAKQKYFPTEDEKKPNPRFFNNRVVTLLKNNSEFTIAVTKKKLSWTPESDWVVKILAEIKKSQEYKQYLFSSADTIDSDKEFLIYIYKYHIATSEYLHEMLEEKSIFWADDVDFVLSLIIKTIKSCEENKIVLLPLYNAADDKEFILELFRKSIIHNKEFEEIISDKTQNWEVERIAVIDIVLMKMAIAELLYFSSIPIKVTLNEYIDISKEYSTPKSKVFINGILDKIVAQLKSEGKIVKVGRGLLET